MASTAAVPTGRARAYAYVPGPASRRGEAGHECQAAGRRASRPLPELCRAAARGEASVERPRPELHYAERPRAGSQTAARNPVERMEAGWIGWRGGVEPRPELRGA